MSILVTGGAGYIGSVTVELMREAGEDIVVLDNLSRGHRAAVDPAIPFYQGDIGDRELVMTICREHAIEACVHFAAFAYVGESVKQPEMYYANNVEQGVRLLGALVDSGVRKIVFSSTCATYGEPQRLPLDESHPQSPANPYGWSKFVMERMLEDYETAHGLQHVALRYFNACGAIPTRGEDHDPESHLIPLVLFAADGKNDTLTVFGDDYPTPDGTAVRDYIHVADLADAHIRSLRVLREGKGSQKINLGNGTGYSVKEVIDVVAEVTGREVPFTMGPRRAGDPSRLIADATRAHDVLGWEPKYPDLRTIVQHAWTWYTAHPTGYDD
jgi:UDP-glucose 4-epimerase